MAPSVSHARSGRLHVAERTAQAEVEPAAHQAEQARALLGCELEALAQQRVDTLESCGARGSEMARHGRPVHVLKLGQLLQRQPFEIVQPQEPKVVRGERADRLAQDVAQRLAVVELDEVDLRIGAGEELIDGVGLDGLVPALQADRQPRGGDGDPRWSAPRPT